MSKIRVKLHIKREKILGANPKIHVKELSFEINENEITPASLRKLVGDNVKEVMEAEHIFVLSSDNDFDDSRCFHISYMTEDEKVFIYTEEKLLLKALKGGE